MPYGSKLLTSMSGALHTAFHADLNKYLSKFTITVGGKLITLGQSNLATKIATNAWKPEEIAQILRKFMASWKGGKYASNFEKEAEYTLDKLKNGGPP